MRWLKGDIWKAGITSGGVLLLLVLMTWIPFSAVGAHETAQPGRATATGAVQATSTVDLTVTALAKDQLKQQNDKLQRENSFPWTILNALGGTILVALAALAGTIFGFRQWRRNQKDERVKRAEERFQKVVEGFGSDKDEAKVGAAIMLRTFLQPGYEQFYRQAFDLAVAHLHLRKANASAPGLLSSPAQVLIVPKWSLQEQQPPPPSASIPLDSLSQALITVFKESFPLARKEVQKPKAPFDPQLLDATDVRLDHAYLVRADLVLAWLVRASFREANLSEARLEKADLSLAQLQGAHLSRAQLQGANLSLAQLEKADLRRAQLQGANLREAQLQGANLREAQLEKAKLFGAQLQGAHLFGAQLEKADLREAQLQEAHLFGAQLQGAHLREAQLQGANLSLAQLQEADLSRANPEDADSLKDTKMNDVIGLTPEQREMCIKKGAIFDDLQQAPASDTSSSSSLPPAQSTDGQALSAPSTQVSTPTPETDGSSTTSSKLGPES